MSSQALAGSELDMFSLTRQIGALTLMGLKGIPSRVWLSVATIGAVAMAVAVLLAFLAMAAGFKATTNSAGANDVALVMRSGAEAELNSVISREQAVLL